MPEDDYARLERATEDLQAPFALIDLDALRANAQDLERRAGAKPIRLASKSLRCRALQQQLLPAVRRYRARSTPSMNRAA